MNVYPQQPQTYSDLLYLSYKHYLKTFKISLPLILLGVVLKDIVIFFGGFPQQSLMKWVIVLLIVLSEVYLSAVILYLAHHQLAGEPRKYLSGVSHIYKKISIIYMGFFALVLAFCGIFFVGYLLSTFVITFFKGSAAFHNILWLLFIGFPLTGLLVLSFYAIPLLILNPINLAWSFLHSFSMIGYKYWLRTFSIYACMLLIGFMVSPMTLHEQWLTEHSLNFVFDASVLIIILPFMTNLILFSLNDLQVRMVYF